LLSFAVGDRAVPELAERIVAWLEAPSALRARTSAGLVEVARARFSWEGVADAVVAAACGDLEGLARPA
jgi:glycosyltransferase involved in cell wall biosynthesis